MALKISERNLKNQKNCKTDASEVMVHFHTFTRTWSAKSTTVSACYSFRHQENKPLTFKNSSTKLIHLPSTSSPPPSLPPKKIGSSKNICWNLGSSSRSWGISTSGSSSTQKIDGCQKSYCNSDAKTTKVPCFVYGFDLFTVMVITSMVINTNCDIMLYIYINNIFKTIYIYIHHWISDFSGFFNSLGSMSTSTPPVRRAVPPKASLLPLPEVHRPSSHARYRHFPKHRCHSKDSKHGEQPAVHG